MSLGRLLCLAAMVGLLAACAAQGPAKLYEGPERSLTELVLVTVPEQIEVMAIDGKEPPGNFLRSRQQLALAPGEHVFSLRYVELFQITADEHDVVRSRQAALRFTAEAGTEYRLEMPAQPNREAARQFAKSPEFALVNAKSGASTPSTAIQSFAEASLIDTITKAFSTNAQDAGPVSNADLMKDIWGRSSPVEKAAFREWLQQQGQ